MLPIRDDSTPINVRWFGADPTGAGDSTAAIQASLNYAATFSTGRAVYIPRGVYQITNSLIVSSKTRVCGDGMGATVLRGKAGAYAGVNVGGTVVLATMGAAASNHVIIEDLTVDHQTNGTVANGLGLVPDGNFAGTPCTDCLIQRVEVLGHVAHEYLIWSQRGQRIRILDCFVDGFTTVFQDPPTFGQEGIEIFGGYDVLVHGNTVRRCNDAGLNGGAAVGGTNSESVNVVWSDNTVENCGYGIHTGTAVTTGVPQNLTNVTISDNAVRGCSIAGIFLNTPLAGTTLTAVAISDNVVNGGPIGIQLQGINGEVGVHRGVKVADNEIHGATTTVVAALTCIEMSNVDILDNVITNSSGEAVRFSTTTDVRFAGNRIEACQKQAVLGGTETRLVIHNNRFINTGLGGFAPVNVTAGVQLVVAANEFSSTGGSTEIVVAGTSAWTTRNIMIGGGAAAHVQNLATNANVGVTGAVGAVANFPIANTLATNAVNTGAQIVVTQVAGPAIAFTVTRNATGFQLNPPGAAFGGTESFQWEIHGS